MSWISILCFIGCFVIIISLFRKDAEIFTPLRVFGFIWLLAVGLADLKLSHYQHEWSFFGWIILFIGIISFVTGIFAVYVINFNKKVYSKPEIRDAMRLSKTNPSLLFNIILILFIFYFASYAVIVAAKGFIPIFHVRPSESRVYFGMFGVGLLIHLAPIVMFLIVVFFSLISKKYYHKSALFFVGLITFVSYFFLLQRFDLILWVIISFVFLYYSTNVLRPRNMLIMTAFLGSITYSVQFIRMSKFVANYLYLISRMKFSVKYAVFTEPYMYISMCLENFANAVTKLDTHTYGYFTFNSIMSVTGLKHWIKEYAAIFEYPHMLTNNYNTYTMFWDYYRDFGVIGLALVSMSLGFIITTLYYKMKTSPNINTVTMYSLGVFIMAISFFNSPIGLMHFMMNVILLFFVTRLLTQKTN